MGSTLMKRISIPILLVLAVLVLAGVFGTAGAQTYPPPTPSPAGAQGSNDECADVETTSGRDTTTLARDQDFVMKGDPASGRRCADTGVRVEFILSSDPVVLGATTARADGTYTSPVLTIPRDTTPGSHVLSARTTFSGRSVTYSRAVTITGAGGLPTTGRDIALLTLWGIFLVGFGSVLISASWKRWRTAKVPVSVSASEGIDPRDSVLIALDRATGPLVEDSDEMELRPVSTTAIPISGATARSSDLILEPAGHDTFDSLVDELDVPDEPTSSLAEPVEKAVRQASVQTSDLVSRLCDEIKAWSDKAET
jgi:hypothetical protein